MKPPLFAVSPPQCLSNRSPAANPSPASVGAVPMSLTRRSLILTSAAALAACARRPDPATRAPMTPGATPEMMALVAKYSEIHGIPESLLHRVIQRESGYNPGARNGPYYGLMQILPQTAQTMGYR
ncbi:MAG: hypothetical protein EON48_02475, partial [Acetobacteraceae bacterium]